MLLNILSKSKRDYRLQTRYHLRKIKKRGLANYIRHDNFDIVHREINVYRPVYPDSTKERWHARKSF